MADDKWASVGHLFNLPDFLTYRATGDTSRSVCSLTCKCCYGPIGDNQGWDRGLFNDIGLDEFATENFSRIAGNGKVLFAGDAVGNGLNKLAAEELGLLEGTPVGSAVIDAYAGAIATLGATTLDEDKVEGTGRLAIICGTSSCHIAMSRDPIFVPGIWGPYLSVLVPDMWCAEGGQSSTGQLIDFILDTHPSSYLAKALATDLNVDIYAHLNERLSNLAVQRNLSHVYELTRHYHVYPDFHGNRSPLSDPSLRGTIVGQSLDTSLDDLGLRYLATLQAIACQTRQIIEQLNGRGYVIDTLCLSGGLCQNDMFVRLHADITGCRVLLPESLDAAVVVGAAFLGARAAATTGDRLWDVMVTMTRSGETISPDRRSPIVELCERKYRIFRSMLDDQRRYRDIMEA